MKRSLYNARMMYLAIDRGGKRTGLAVGDDVLKLASPVDVIHTASEDELLRQIDIAVAEHLPDELVLGLPLNMDDSEGPSAKVARKFADKLSLRTGKVVHLVDERLSSYYADQLMSQTGLTHGQKKARRDALAAANILQAFLDGASE